MATTTVVAEARAEATSVGRGKNDHNRRQPVQQPEVHEEDVQKQVKGNTRTPYLEG